MLLACSLPCWEAEKPAKNRGATVMQGTEQSSTCAEAPGPHTWMPACQERTSVLSYCLAPGHGMMLRCTCVSTALPPCTVMAEMLLGGCSKRRSDSWASGELTMMLVVGARSRVPLARP